MKKKDIIGIAIGFAVLFLSLIVGAALLDDRVIKRTTYTSVCTIELLAYLAYLIYLLRKHFSTRKKAKEIRLKIHNATMSGTLKHVSGLPLAKGLMVEMFYGPDKITFKKDGQEINISRDKVTSIDIVTGDGTARKAMGGAATGKYVVGGTAGAAVGALAAIDTYLVISYTSEGESKSIRLDTASSGTFPTKVVKDFRQTYHPKRTTIDL